jgi:hypothetical protein
MNKVEDALSQRPCIFSLIPLQMNLQEKILTIQFDDDWYKEVKETIEQDTMMVPKFEGYILDKDELMRYNNQIYVSPRDKLRSLILSQSHREMYMAHPRVTKIRTYLNTLFFWKGMKVDIVSYASRCLECQQVKGEHRHPIGLLQPHTIPESKWEVI